MLDRFGIVAGQAQHLGLQDAFIQALGRRGRLVLGHVLAGTFATGAGAGLSESNQPAWATPERAVHPRKNTTSGGAK